MRAYDGPLFVSRPDATHPEAGAAGDAVECATWGAGGFSITAVYRDGATADTPEGALRVAQSERLYDGVWTGLSVAKTEPNRVLYVVEVNGERKQAVVLRDGPAIEGAGGAGWYVESWARCDQSELPASYLDAIGLQTWTDRDGNPVPTSRVEAWRGPAHCGWESMTFLYLDGAGEAGSGSPNAGIAFVRDPQPDLDDYFAGPYRTSQPLPADAEPTGYSREGQQLWLAADRSYAYVADDNSVEAWPVTTRPLYCA